MSRLIGRERTRGYYAPMSTPYQTLDECAGQLDEITSASSLLQVARESAPSSAH